MWIPIDPSITWRCVDVSGSSGHSAGHPDHLAGLAGPAQLGPAGPFPFDLSHVSHYRFPHFFVWMTPKKVMLRTKFKRCVHYHELRATDCCFLGGFVRSNLSKPCAILNITFLAKCRGTDYDIILVCQGPGIPQSITNNQESYLNGLVQISGLLFLSK